MPHPQPKKADQATGGNAVGLSEWLMIYYFDDLGHDMEERERTKTGLAPQAKPESLAL